MGTSATRYDGLPATPSLRSGRVQVVGGRGHTQIGAVIAYSLADVALHKTNYITAVSLPRDRIWHHSRDSRMKRRNPMPAPAAVETLHAR